MRKAVRADTSGAPGPGAGSEATSWPSLILVYVAGVLAAAGFGQLGPVVPLLRQELGISLGQVGWAISAVTALAALLGTPAGLWVRRLGGRPAMLAGSLTMGVAAVAAALAWRFEILLVSRVVAGVGYLLMVIAGPGLTVRFTHPRHQALGLGLWGTFVPVGIAVSSAAGGVLGDTVGWRGWLWCYAAVVTATGAVLLLLPRDRLAVSGGRSPRVRVTELPGGMLLLALGFCLVALVSVVVNVLLPTFLAEVRQLGLGSAGGLAGLTAVLSVPGSLLAGALLSRGVRYRTVALLGLAVPPGAVLVFGVTGWLGNVIAASLVSVLLGMLVACSFAAVPVLTDGLERLDLGNGLLAQLGSVGALVGPPLVGTAVELSGWAAVPVSATVFVLVGTVLLWLALRREDAPRPPAGDGRPG